MPQWAVAISAPQSEAKAVINLERIGFEPYYPKIKVKRFYGRRRAVQIEPLFPRYLFVKQTPQWAALRATQGISGIVMSGDRPATLPNEVIDTIKGRCDRDGIFIPPSPFSFKIGQKVQIGNGPHTYFPTFVARARVFRGLGGGIRPTTLPGINSRNGNSWLVCWA